MRGWSTYLGKLEAAEIGGGSKKLNDVVHEVEQPEKLIIPASLLELICNSSVRTQVDIYIMLKAMIDTGANVNLAPIRLAKILGLHVQPHTDGHTTGTAGTDGSMVVCGWIHPRGYTGPIALVEKTAFILLSVTHLQMNGMTSYFWRTHKRVF